MRWPWTRRHRRAEQTNTPSAEPAQQPDREPPPPTAHGAVPETVVVFLHLPKCAGTSLHQWMQRVLAPGVLSPERLRLPADLPPERLADLQRYRVFSGHFDVIDLGHFPTPQRRFTVFRDPVDRLVSLYDFWRAHDPEFVEAHDLTGPRLARAMSFDEFVAEPHPDIVHDLDNTMVRTFAGRVRDGDPLDQPEEVLARAVEFVRTLDHVGEVSQMERTLRWLCDQFGLPADAADDVGYSNVRGEWAEPHLQNVGRTEVSPEAAAALEPLVRLDRRLIEHTGH